MFDPVTAGKKIAIYRKNAGLTQDSLARILSVSPQAVSKWENGRTMPDISLLVRMSEIFGRSIDDILLPTNPPSSNANFAHILLPYGKIADFSGRKWPRSMATPAILSAIKLFMGLENHVDSQNRQINDDTEYILQSAVTSICYGYSWGRGITDSNGLSLYGLSCDVLRSKEYSYEEMIKSAAENILRGYPVIVEPVEYSDVIFATGFYDDGKTLKGIAFLDGDDDKNSVMSFHNLQDFPGWYRDDIRVILLKPLSAESTSVKSACKLALQEGYRLLNNQTHQFEHPLVGYGLIIYDNWCRELQKENDNNLPAMECHYPHIFIHYEGKIRLKQFLEYCIHILDDVDKPSLEKAISKYAEIIDLCEKHMPSLLTDKPTEIWAVKSQRQWFSHMLQRSKELEIEALACLKMAITSLE